MRLTIFEVALCRGLEWNSCDGTWFESLRVLVDDSWGNIEARGIGLDTVNVFRGGL
jgi:hypothetical protein